MIVTPPVAEQMAARIPPTPMTTLISKVRADPAARVIMASKDGRLSEQVHQFIGAAPQLAMLRTSYGSFAYTLVRSFCDFVDTLLPAPFARWDITRHDGLTRTESGPLPAGHDTVGRVCVFGRADGAPCEDVRSTVPRGGRNEGTFSPRSVANV